MTTPSHKANWPEALLELVSDYIYIFDTDSLEIIHASACVLKKYDNSLRKINNFQPEALPGGISKKYLKNFLAENAHLGPGLHVFPAADGLQCHDSDCVRFAIAKTAEKQRLLVIKRNFDMGNTVQQTPHTNIPGLIFRFTRNKNKEILIEYLSDGCEDVLGLGAGILIRDPMLFLDMMPGKDRASFVKSILSSEQNLDDLNWEGQIRIKKRQDIKWINIRSKPRKLENGAVRWEGIISNITESKNREYEISESRRLLAELSLKLNHVKEKERVSIAREIHDGIGGNIAAIKIGLASIMRLLSDEEAIHKLKHLEAIIDHTFTSAYKIASGLRPDALELGIVAALDWQASDFTAQFGIACSFKSNDTDARLYEDQDITLFRICQEALTNIAKHAQASHVDIVLTFGRHHVMLTISDDGISMPPDSDLIVNSPGVQGMYERIGELKGSFRIERDPELGTSRIFKLPYKKKKLPKRLYKTN